MNSRLSTGIAFLTVALASLAFWLGCEQKGTIAPTSTGQGELFYFDTVRVSTSALAPSDQLSFEAHVLSESGENGSDRSVRFTASRGHFLGADADTILNTSSDGWASVTYVAPEDTGAVTLRAELLAMSEIATRTVSVTATGQPLEGQLYLWADTDTLFADNGQSSVAIYARLRNSANNPIGGASVTFTTTQGTVGSPAITDSATGVAATTLYSGATPGNARVKATYGVVSDSLDVAFVAPYPAASVVVNALPPQITAGLDSATIRAVVYDAQGQTVVDNTLVIFSTDRGTLSSSQGRTVSGVAVTRLYAPPSIGVARVTANVGAGVTDYTDVEIVPGPLAGIALIPEDDSLYADNYSTTQIHVYATDEFGNAVQEGTPISFEAYCGSITPSATVDANGYVMVVYQAGLTAGPTAVRAWNGSVESSVSIYLMSTPAATVSLTAVPTQLPADGSSSATLTALVLDSESRPVSDGTVVTFTSIMGVLGAQGGPAASVPGWARAMRVRGEDSEEISVARLATNSARQSGPVRPRGLTSGNGATADSRRSSNPGEPGWNPTESVYTTTTINGYASAVLTSATTAGVDTATASVGVVADQKFVTYLAGEPAQISVEPEAESIPADGVSTTSITVRVKDSFGNLVGAGVNVTVQTTLGSLFPLQGHTNTEGIFITELQSERRTGNAAITASSGSAGGYGEVEFAAPDVAAISVQAESTSLLADGMATTALEAYVVDESAVPVFGAQVTWQVGSGIGTVYPTQSVTDSSGIALATFRSGASSADETQQVTAATGGLSDDVTIHMRGITITVTAQNQILPADGEATTQVRAQVTETSSHVALADVTVIFATTLGSIPQSGQTNTSGMASVSLTSGVTVGLASVTAQYGDTLRAMTQVSMISTQGDVIALYSESPTLLGNGVSTTQLQAYVVDEGGWPTAGEEVTFTVLSGVGTVTPSVVSTGVDGYAYATFRSSAINQDVETQIEALIERGTSEATVSVLGVTLVCSASPGMIVADGHSTSSIQAQLYETTSTVAIGEAVVYFGTSLGSIPNMAMTNSSGIATVTLTSGTTTGNARVIARYGNTLRDTVEVGFAESTPTYLYLSANPTIILADNSSTSIITVVVTDQGGNPVPNGTQIQFSLVPNSGSIENLRTTTGGAATNVLTSGADPDTVMVLAWAAANPSARDSVQVIYRVGPPAVVQLAAQSDTLKADGISVDTIYATVTDAVGHLLSNVEVQFQTTIGNIPQSRTTNGDGVARVAFSSPTTGIATITASAGTGSDNYTIYLVPGCPWSVEMEYYPHSVGVRESGRNETLLITATVKDASNNPVVDGTLVWFDIYSQPITHPDSMGSLSSEDSIPTINGQASVSYTSGYRSGTVRIRARSHGTCEGNSYNVSAITTEILIYAGPPYIEDIYNPDGCGYFNTSHIKVASEPCDLMGWSAVGDSVRITAIVGDRWNNPVTEGTAVYFTTSGGVIATATGFTDADGFASVLLFGGNPMPTLDRWWNTLEDPNLGGQINCWGAPDRDGIAKVLVTTEGETQNNQSAIVWATCWVRFTAPYDYIQILQATVNGDPNERTLYIGQNALVTFELWEGGNHWPIDSESIVRLSANAGLTYPNLFTVECPGDTIYTISFFNNLTTQDDATATPVLIEVESKNGDLWAFTETFLLLPQMPPEESPVDPPAVGRVDR